MTEQPDPRVNDICVFPQSQHPDGPYGGMMLRDYFAAQALAGTDTIELQGWSFPHMAEHFYQIADAMLQERGK